MVEVQFRFEVIDAKVHAMTLGPRAACLLMVLAYLMAWADARAQDAVTPGSLLATPALQHLGVRWTITGDDDNDSQLVLEYRRLGEVDWQPAASPMRARPGLMVNGAPLNLNYWAASALFLEPDTDYEVRVTLSDPDGGGTQQVIPAATRAPRSLPANSRYVVPGNGGGDGSMGNPYQGLQAAAEAAQPGDRFLIAPGSYSEFTLTASGTPVAPIAFLGQGSGVIIDGDDTDRGVVILEDVSHVILRHLTIQNGAWGIDAQNTADIEVRFNTIQDVDFAVYNRRENGVEKRQVVCDNHIVGRTSWPNIGIPAERAIDLRGDENIVCHNRIRNFGDCVSVQPFSGPSHGNDIYGNDVQMCVDDGIEVDFNQSNVRVWGNRVTNTRMGISVQPIAGGPAYLFRNTLFNTESQPIKLNNQPSGLVVAHNTGVRIGNGLSDPGVAWQNAVFRNNLILGTEYAFEFTTLTPPGTFRDFDHGAWGTTRAGTVGEPWFKWEDVRYATLADLVDGAGVEGQGVEAGFADLMNAALPPGPDTAVDPETPDLRLAPGAPEINAGISLPNLNLGYTLIGAPDMGALESAGVMPFYGPRAVTCELAFVEGGCLDTGLVFRDGFE